MPDAGGRENLTHHIPFDDLRGWIAEADRLGELRHVTGASWQEEIGMAAGLVSHSETAPALLFDEVPGFPKGFRVLVNIFAGKRKNMTLGFPAEFDKVELSEALAAVYCDDAKLIPPVMVEDGPILDNILLGDDVDLDVFPTPVWHEKDGGRYIGTGSYNVTRDPDTGWLNLGTYRVMIKDKRTVGHNVLSGKHASYHNEKYTARGERMPMAIVCGGDPTAFLAGGIEAPPGISEYDVIGGARGKPVELVQGKVTGLPFPANAEIVLEGYVNTDRIETEGPFGDWSGTYTEEGRLNPVVEISAIYYRNDPIMLGFAPQSLPDEYSRFRAITRSGLLKKNIEAAGVPDVTAVWCHEVGGACLLYAVAIKQRYPGHARQAGHVASMCRFGNEGNRWVMVIDDDVDPASLDEVMWAMLTRADPATSIDLIKGALGAKSDPRLSPDKRASGDITTSRMIVDACRPYHWRDQFPDINKPSPEHAARAQEKFGYLLE